MDVPTHIELQGLGLGNRLLRFDPVDFTLSAFSFYALWFTQFNPEGLFNRGSKKT